MKNTIWGGVAFIAAFLACDDASRRGSLSSQPGTLQEDTVKSILRVAPDWDPGSEPLEVDDNGISFHGGPVMNTVPGQPVTLYYIWYGNWAGDTARGILADLANNLGGSPYFKVNTTYCDTSDCTSGGNPVLNVVAYGGSVDDNYSHGTNLTDAAVRGIVADSLGLFPTDVNGVYLVLTSQDVSQNGILFCRDYCAWHRQASINSTSIKYGFVGNPLHCSSTQCTRQRTNSPNENPAADGMASLIAHELDATVTDPFGNKSLNGAWYDNNLLENADKCNFTYGESYQVPNGSLANMMLGQRDFYIQQNWVNRQGGFCGKSMAPQVVSFMPTSGHQGDSVMISGYLFMNVRSVTIAGVDCAFQVIDVGRITATLPGDAPPGVGPIRIASDDGVGTSTTDFIILGAPPEVLSFSPTSAHPGDSVDIRGTGFVGITGPSGVKFGSLNAARYTVVSEMEIVAVVPSGSGISGPISVTGLAGTGMSRDPFTFLGRSTATGNLSNGRANHTASLLSSGPHAGNVLVVGGNFSGVPLVSAELFEPDLGTFTPTGSLNQARAYHTATTLPDGTVLVIGGGDDSSSLPSAEIYDPATGLFALTGSLGSPRRGHTATLLSNGRVLATGGLVDQSTSLSSMETYDPATGSFMPAGDLALARHFHTATVLQNGDVLFVGGPGTTPGSAGRTGELLSSGLAGNFADPRISHTAVLLNDGRVLIGGIGGVGTTAMYYDPSGGAFITFAAPGNGGNHMAVALVQGGVALWTGGSSNPGTSRLHVPATGDTYFSSPLIRGRNSHTATVLANGTILLVGGLGVSAATAEIYDYNSP